MSASTEYLVEQINILEEAIQIAESQGQEAAGLKFDLRQLHRRLQAASEALTESKQILKS